MSLRLYLVATALLMLGCESAPRSGLAAGEPQPAERQELLVAAGADEFVLDVNQHRLGMYPLNTGICETLVRLTPDFRADPWLARSWEYRGEDTYRFVLRSGVIMHDGQPFTAEAVKYSLQRAVRTGIGHSFLSEESVLVVDDTTVDVRTTYPNRRLVEQLVHPSYSMVAPGSDPRERPVCTGPFRFVEYVPRDRMIVERNDSYWGEKARLERIVFRFYPDENTRALALRSGEVDLITEVHRSMVAGLRAVPGIQMVDAPPGGVILTYIGTSAPPPYTLLADRDLRRAVALAIDRQVLSERVLDGHADAVPTVNPPPVLGSFATRVHGVAHDPAAASRLLDSLGWRSGRNGVRTRNGERLRLKMIFQPNAFDSAVPQFVQAELARVGIETRIEQLDPGAYSSRLNSGQFDLDLELPNQNDANPAFLLGLRWYGRSDVRSSRFMRVGADFDALVEEALGAPDHRGAQEKAAEAMHLLLDREVAAIPLAGVYRIYAMKERVRGFTPHPARTHQAWSGIWVAR